MMFLNDKLFLKHNYTIIMIYQCINVSQRDDTVELAHRAAVTEYCTKIRKDIQYILSYLG